MDTLDFIFVALMAYLLYFKWVDSVFDVVIVCSIFLATVFVVSVLYHTVKTVFRKPL